VLYGLSGYYNAGPAGSLTMDSEGNLYGATPYGGIHDAGSIFKLMPMNGTWTYTDLYDFRWRDGAVSLGAFPNGGIVLDANGDLYGTAQIGGPENSNCPSGCGVIWKITP
jgi:uncharacterized repeat protein (TIGR03803 family)